MALQAAVTAADGRATARAAERGSTPGTDRSQSDGDAKPGATTVVSNVAGFGENLFNLAELQARMLATELRQDLEAAKTRGAVVVAGALVVAGGVLLALAGISELMVSELGLKRGYALLITSGAAILCGGLCAAFGRAWLGRRWLTFPASGEELTRNLNWVRTVLRHSGRSPTRR
jgi:hypothetical protein